MLSINLNSDQSIREDAYYLWELDGRPEGRDLVYWESARKKLSGASGQAIYDIQSIKINYEGGISAQPPIMHGKS
jgi:hypothetical protein